MLLRLPDSWNHLAPSSGGQRGKQLLAFAEHQRISEAGVGQSGAGSADTEQVIAQNHGSLCRHCGAFWERLIYAAQRGDEGSKRENRTGGGERTERSGWVMLPAVILTCSSDISNHVKSVLVDGSSQRKGDGSPTVLLVEHSEHQAPQVCHRGPVQLHKGPLLAVIGPVATSHLTDDHTFRGRRRAGTAVLPQRGGWSYLQRLMQEFLHQMLH